MNLNTIDWQPFLLKDLYEIVMGNGFDKNKMTDDLPLINFVSRISYNNGVDIKVDLVNGVNPFKSGTLTVALGGSYLGSCFVQEEPYYTGQNVAVMTPKSPLMTHSVNLFISTLVRYESKIKYYAFGRELNTHIKTDFSISLPVQHNEDTSYKLDENKEFSPDGYIPDWDFMDNYIKSLNSKPITTKNKRKKVPLIYTSEWREFSIPRLFKVEAGIYYYEDEYEKGTVPYITASDVNNGIGDMINHSPDFKGNQITIGKIGASAHYQPFPFCATSDVNVLTPRFKMNKYHGLFITNVLNFSENYKWSYGRQCRIGDTNTIIIKLPVACDKNGVIIKEDNNTYSDDGFVPDWAYMEKYIKSLLFGDRI